MRARLTKLFLSSFLPALGQIPEPVLSKQEPPAVMPDPSPVLPQRSLDQFTLPNGLRIIYEHRPAQPVLHVDLRLRLNPGEEPREAAGLTAFTLQAMLECGAGLNASSLFHRETEQLGVRLSPFQEGDRAGFSLRSPERDPERILGYFADMLLRPRWEAGPFEALRLKTQASLRLGVDALWIASKFQSAVAEANYLPAPPTEGSVSEFSRERVQDFHARLFRPERSVLCISGTFPAEQVRQWVTQFFASWPSKPSSLASTLPSSPRRLFQKPLSVLTLPPSRPTVLWAGLQIQCTEEERPMLHLLERVLVDTPSSPLHLALRSRNLRFQVKFLPLKDSWLLLLAFEIPGVHASSYVRAVRKALGDLAKRGLDEATFQRGIAILKHHVQLQPRETTFYADQKLGLTPLIVNPSCIHSLQSTSLQLFNRFMARLLVPDKIRWLLAIDSTSLQSQEETLGEIERWS